MGLLIEEIATYGFSRILLILSDISRIVLPLCFWLFVIEFTVEYYKQKNDRILLRIIGFMAGLAAVSSWISMIHFDRRFDIIPALNLNQIILEWNWLSSILIFILLVRLRQVLKYRSNT